MYCFLNPPHQVVPGRMALLVTLFLVLINIFNNVTNVSPNTEGMTAISSWMLGQSVNLLDLTCMGILFLTACIFFLFGALMSYAFILYILLQQKLTKQRSKRFTFQFQPFSLNKLYSAVTAGVDCLKQFIVHSIANHYVKNVNFVAGIISISSKNLLTKFKKNQLGWRQILNMEY